MNPAWSDPILSCAEARALERRLFGDDEAREWAAMQRAGAAVARAVLEDFKEIGGFPPAGRLLVLAGKGHNGGDALLAARTILEQFPAARATVLLVLGERALRPLAWRAWRELLRRRAGSRHEGCAGKRRAGWRDGLRSVPGRHLRVSVSSAGRCDHGRGAALGQRASRRSACGRPSTCPAGCGRWTASSIRPSAPISPMPRGS